MLSFTPLVWSVLQLRRVYSALSREYRIIDADGGAEYVSTVTGGYRRAIDFYSDHYRSVGFEAQFKDLQERGVNEVSKVYSRGFSTGFYHGKPLDQWPSRGGSNPIE